MLKSSKVACVHVRQSSSGQQMIMSGNAAFLEIGDTSALAPHQLSLLPAMGCVSAAFAKAECWVAAMMPPPPPLPSGG